MKDDLYLGGNQNLSQNYSINYIAKTTLCIASIVFNILSRVGLNLKCHLLMKKLNNTVAFVYFNNISVNVAEIQHYQFILQTMRMEDSQESAQASIFAGPSCLRLWQRRYFQVQRILDRYFITKLLDIGCSQAKFLQRLSRSSQYELLIGMDLDEQLLSTTSINNIAPQAIQDSILYDRQEPLTIKIYSGNATIPHPNLIIQPIQAITLIQVIQHLPFDNVPLLNECLFKYYQPGLVIITTPNSDFNQYFGEEKGKMRHWDHKFEWSRAQFHSYCQQVKRLYEYEYQLFGVGQHISGGLSRGYCTQGAIFKRMTHKVGNLPQLANMMDAKLIKEQKYPFWKDKYENDLRSLVIQECYRRSRQDQNQSSYTIQELATQIKRISYILQRSNINYDTFKEILSKTNSLFFDQMGRVCYNECEQEDHQQFQQQQQY